jgi:crotonobetaine/carnitine-CoA ligase
MVDLSSLNLRDFLRAAVDEAPDDPFLIFTGDDCEYSYSDAATSIDRAAAAWHALGVRKGDRVAFMLDNSPLFIWAWFGLAQIGGILVAVNTGLRAQETAFIVADSGAKFALVGDNYLSLMDEVQSTNSGLVILAAEGSTRHRFIELMATASPTAPQVELNGSDIISLIYTSGTTGNPKGVMQTHRNFVLTGQAYIAWMHMEPGDRIYACLPLFHINSQAYSAMSAIAARGALVLAPKFSASRFWADVRRHHVTVFNFIGAMAMILSKKDVAAEDADNDVRIAYGVPALATEIIEEVESRFGLRVLSGFGMSETTFGLLEPLDGPRRPGTMGVPRHHPNPDVPRTEAKIVSEDSSEVEDGVVGELMLKNAAMMLGYFGDETRTRKALADGWLRTGDSAYRDADGFYFFVDRLKDIVRRRGENISSLEVERTIARHPLVSEAAVIGVPADLSDEELLVFVVPRDPDHPLEAQEIFEWTAANLAAFKVPLYLRFVPELPKTATAKVQKEKLRSADAADPSSRVSRADLRLKEETRS